MKPQTAHALGLKAFFFMLLINCLLISCSRDGIKEKINKTGEVAGVAVGEFSSGIRSGVEKAVEPSITGSDQLKNAGLTFGKMIISSDSGASDNVLQAYIVFNQSFTGTLTAKAFDNKNNEMGRASVDVNGQKDDAHFEEFHFDRRTNIDNDSRITIDVSATGIKSNQTQ